MRSAFLLNVVKSNQDEWRFRKGISCALPGNWYRCWARCDWNIQISVSKPGGWAKWKLVRPWSVSIGQILSLIRALCPDLPMLSRVIDICSVAESLIQATRNINVRINFSFPWRYKKHTWIFWFVFLQMERIIYEGDKSVYEVRTFTGNRLGASTKADIKIILAGDKGRTDEIFLKDSRTYKVKFQRGQEDVFRLNTFNVGPLKMIYIGHDRKELGESQTCLKVYSSRMLMMDTLQWSTTFVF